VELAERRAFLDRGAQGVLDQLAALFQQEDVARQVAGPRQQGDRGGLFRGKEVAIVGTGIGQRAADARTRKGVADAVRPPAGGRAVADHPHLDVGDAARQGGQQMAGGQGRIADRGVAGVAQQPEQVRRVVKAFLEDRRRDPGTGLGQQIAQQADALAVVVELRVLLGVGPGECELLKSLR
jgi:hypothetical protein